MAFGIMYIMLGVLFTGIAAYSGQESGWSLLTIVYAIIAIVDFGAGVRHIQRYRLNKSKK
ncbi:MAG TPA: DUF4305 domain-containing protein [Pseudogracilibacillus sp.]|nr:DUF4305 domain-containing protein [Pseudogracilibacillus sp.]